MALAGEWIRFNSHSRMSVSGWCLPAGGPAWAWLVFLRPRSTYTLADSLSDLPVFLPSHRHLWVIPFELQTLLGRKALLSLLLWGNNSLWRVSCFCTIGDFWAKYNGQWAKGCLTSNAQDRELQKDTSSHLSPGGIWSYPRMLECRPTPLPPQIGVFNRPEKKSLSQGQRDRWRNHLTQALRAINPRFFSCGTNPNACTGHFWLPGHIWAWNQCRLLCEEVNSLTPDPEVCVHVCVCECRFIYT